MLISGVIGEGAYGDDPALGALYGVLTAVAYTGFILVLRHAGRDLRRPAGPLFEATLVATVVAIVAGALLGEVDLVPSWPAHGWLLTLALTSQVLGWLLIAVALPRLPASLTSIVLTVQPVGSVAARDRPARRGPGAAAARRRGGHRRRDRDRDAPGSRCRAGDAPTG